MALISGDLSAGVLRLLGLAPEMWACLFGTYFLWLDLRFFATDASKRLHSYLSFPRRGSFSRPRRSPDSVVMWHAAAQEEQQRREAVASDDSSSSLIAERRRERSAKALDAKLKDREFDDYNLTIGGRSQMTMLSRALREKNNFHSKRAMRELKRDPKREVRVNKAMANPIFSSHFETSPSVNICLNISVSPVVSRT